MDRTIDGSEGITVPTVLILKKVSMTLLSWHVWSRSISKVIIPVKLTDETLKLHLQGKCVHSSAQKVLHDKLLKL